MRWIFSLFLFDAMLTVGSGATPVLLQKAADKWLEERDHWAFTQLVREYDGQEIQHERRERYDPSHPEQLRWELLTIDGRQPTEDERIKFDKRKNKKRKHTGKPIADYFDFAAANVVEEDAETVHYHLPLQQNFNWLFPVDKVDLMIVVNKSTEAIEQIRAGLSEPFRVALGLARILDVDLDIEVQSPEQMAANGTDPGSAQPDGTARVVVTKFGQRVDYAWSDFKRVTPHPDNMIPATPKF